MRPLAARLDGAAGAERRLDGALGADAHLVELRLRRFDLVELLDLVRARIVLEHRHQRRPRRRLRPLTVGERIAHAHDVARLREQRAARLAAPREGLDLVGRLDELRRADVRVLPQRRPRGHDRRAVGGQRREARRAPPLHLDAHLFLGGAALVAELTLRLAQLAKVAELSRRRRLE